VGKQINCDTTLNIIMDIANIMLKINDVKVIIENDYLMKVLNVKKINSHIFHITTSNDEYILKVHNHLCKQFFKELSTIYQMTSANNFSPQMIPSKQDLFINNRNDTFFSVHKFLKNEQKLFNLKSLSKRLSKLHRKLFELKITGLDNHFDRLFDVREKAMEYGYISYLPMLDDLISFLKQTKKQIIHSDLHKNNLIIYNNNIYFLDFDSSTYSHTIFDVVFSAFRCVSFEHKKILEFVALYNKFNPPIEIDKRYIVQALTYIILQRILFILIQKKKGNHKYMYDLVNQKKYLSYINKM